MIQIEVGKIYYFCRKFEVLEGVVEKLLSNSAIVKLGNDRTVVSFKNLYENKFEPQKVVDLSIEQKKQKQKREMEKKAIEKQKREMEKKALQIETKTESEKMIDLLIQKKKQKQKRQMESVSVQNENKVEPQKEVDLSIEQENKIEIESVSVQNENKDNEQEIKDSLSKNDPLQKIHFFLEENKDLTYGWLVVVYKGIKCLEIHKFKDKQDAELKLQELSLDEKYSV